MIERCQSCRKMCTCWRECLCMTVTVDEQHPDGVLVCHDCADGLPLAAVRGPATPAPLKLSR